MVRKYAAMGLALAMLLLPGCARQSEQTTAPETSTVQTEPDGLRVLEVREEGDFVLVQTTICTVRYAYAFYDVIEVSTQGDTLVFSTGQSQGTQPLFCVGFGEGEGSVIGTLPDPKTGEVLEVRITICPVDDHLEDSLRGTIMAAQECVNDVVDALQEADGFVPAP